jgi:hypothetical protein
MGFERNGVFLSTIRGAGVASEVQDADHGVARGLSLARALPNPAFAGSEIELTLAAPSAVSVDVYDLAGRRIVSLLDGTTLRAGHQSVFWNLRDAEARRVPAGVYLVRWQVGPTTRALRLVVLP